MLQDKFHEAVVNLTQQRVESHVRLGPYNHGPSDGEEVVLVEKIALEDEGVKAELAKLQLPEGTVIISDPWIYGVYGVTSNWISLDLFPHQVPMASMMTGECFNAFYI